MGGGKSKHMQHDNALNHWNKKGELGAGSYGAVSLVTAATGAATAAAAAATTVSAAAAAATTVCTVHAEVIAAREIRERWRDRETGQAETERRRTERGFFLGEGESPSC